MKTVLYRCLFVAVFSAAEVSPIVAQQAPTVTLALPKQPTGDFRLTERLTIGSMDGEHDAFGRIMDVAIDGRGRILIADDLQHAVLVFDHEGQFLRSLGRQGDGPGEFQAPWRIAVDPQDSIFVWDTQLARMSIFSPTLAFVRSFAISPAWLVNSMKFLPDGSLLVTAYGAADGLTLRTLRRQGGAVTAFGPKASAEGLAGFEASLLGGTADLTRNGIVFSRKSPYELWQFGFDGGTVRRCIGNPDWTTRPTEVVSDDRRGQSLAWNRFVHSSRVIALSDSLFLNVILDPVNDRRVVDLVSADCRLIRRTQLDTPVNFVRYKNGSLVAARTLDYPEVIVYELRLKQDE